jgi:type II secretory pathway component PulC
MVSDTDLGKGELRQPEMEVEQPRKRAVQPARKVAQPKRSMPSSKKNVKLKLFLMVIVILGMVVYYLWTANLISPILKSLPTNKVLVKAHLEQGWLTSIVYSEENATAMVSDRIVHEGDMVDGYKVVKIHRDKVEFEKNGKIFTKQVNK